MIASWLNVSNGSRCVASYGDTLILENCNSSDALEKTTLDKLATDVINKGEETEILKYSYNVVP